MVIRIAESDEEVAACFPVMRQLRPHLEADEFVSMIRKRMPADYKLAYVEVDGRPVAIAGYRITEKLSTGRFLHVDDLVTDEASRSKGYGARLLEWLRDQARAAACRSLQLDTGVQRKDAQRFYEREGMRLSAYHYEIVA
jgi:GNAT superfamily N-acetyltransferase